MLKKKTSTLLLAAITLLISTTMSSTTVRVYADSNVSEAKLEQQVDDETLLLDSQQMAEAFQIQVNQPRLIKYAAKASDTIESIATTYNVKVSTITLSNGISKDAALKEGQELVFPSIDGMAYKIKDGETLWDLSVLYKIDFYDLLEINNLGSPDKLKLGQQIILPGADSVKASSSGSSSSQSSKTAAKTTSSASLSRGIWPASGSLTSKFGKRWGRAHEGIDIGISTGTSVKAFMSGKVTFSGWDGGYGNLVIIRHSNGLESYYGHNSKLLVKVGQTVDAGTVISKSGNTGNSTGPHLHFEIRKNGNPVNPLQYLK